MPRNETTRLQYVRCGKSNCRSCPHGPYWYGFWKENGRTRSRYIGKTLTAKPGQEREHFQTGRREAHKIHEWEAILNRRSATIGLACTILEITEDSSIDSLDSAFRRLSRVHHPDRGGDHMTMTCLEAAYSFVKTWNNWK